MPRLNEILKQPETRVAIIIDNSSSMSPLSKFVVDSFNEQIDELKKIKNQKITVTLAFFSGQTDVKIFDKPIAEVQHLKHDEYKPNGMTALNDATGLIIDKFKQSTDPSKKDLSHLFVIITDGDENASKEYSQATVSNMIKTLQTEGWTFTYLGANQDLNKVVKNYNLHAGNTMEFQPTGASVRASTVNITRGLTNYFAGRESGIMMSDSFYSGAIAEDLKTEIKTDTTSLTEPPKVEYDIFMGNPSLNQNAVSITSPSKK
jgi:hypothetical protein